MNKQNFPTKVVTLVGPPNSGKTTLFNYLSGKNFKTVNYPGSTIEYHKSNFHKKFGVNATLIDSPGIISIIPNSLDEQVTIDSIFNDPQHGIPDLLVVTADETQLTRHLLLSKQLSENGFNVILVLTMSDILKKKNKKIDVPLLSEKIGLKIIEFDGRNGFGLDDLISTIQSRLEENKKVNSVESTNRWLGTEALLNAFNEIELLIKDVIKDSPVIPVKSLNKAKKALKIVNPKLQYMDENSPEPTTLKLDKIFLHKIWGIIIFFLVLAFTFTSIFYLAIPLMDGVDLFFVWLSTIAADFLGNSLISQVISNGILSGLGAVVIFVPQIIILFLILGFLEDSGYLARGAMIVDKPLSTIGMNGRSFMPMLSGFACAVPAVMAARTIPNRKERLLTIFVIPLMSCSARLPVYVLLLAFLTPHNKAWVAGLGLSAIYIFSIIISLVAAAVINRKSKSIIGQEDNSSFILELPSYKLPKVGLVIRNTLTSTKSYLKNAGPIIMLLSVIIWFFTNFPREEIELNELVNGESQITNVVKFAELENSYAGQFGRIVQPIMQPLGMDWRVGVSLVSAFAAREVFVSSLALIFKVSAVKDEAFQATLLKSMREAKIKDTDEYLFTPSKIIGLIVFFIFALQCISTIVITKKETGSWRIPILQLLVYTGGAYLITFIVIHTLQFLGVS